ncbi:putative Zn-dependent protease [Oceanicella actignis]|nr:putative Zn-dependent protease [Oceanicella actignis]
MMTRLTRTLSRAACALAVAAATLQAAPAQALSLIRDAEIEATLRRLSGPVFRAAGLDPDEVRIVILQDPSVNAFVFGGRNMALTTGLLRESERPEQLIGVIAHEAGHIVGGHLARRQIAERNARGPVLLGLALGVAAAAAGGGPAAAAAIAGGGQAAERALLAYSRAEESAADQAALTYLERAGIDPGGMLEVLDRFRGQEVFSQRHQDPFARTHPISAERLSLARARAMRSPAWGRASPPETVYWFDRMRAKLDGFLERPDRLLARLDPADGSEFARLRRAVALHRLPDPDRALAEVDKLIAMRPSDPYYHELKGQILLESGRAAQAVPAYREAVRLAPDEPLILAYLGRALLALNDPAADREARAALEQGAARSGGGDATLLRDLALAYARTGDEGMAALTTAERLAIAGARRDAVNQARRALTLLPKGSPAATRAQDIILSLQDG